MNYDFSRKLGIENLLIVLTVIQYLVAIYFIFEFYKRYREISVLEDAQKLIQRIFRTRRTVKHYVIFCLSIVLLIFAVFVAGIYMDENLMETLDLDAKTQQMDPGQLKWIMVGVMAAAGIVFTALIGVIYFLLYGLLTRKLYRNYQELKRMEA